MKRRLFLGLALAPAVARAVPAPPLTLPSLRDRIDHHAAELAGLVRSIAPEHAGIASIAITSDWSGHHKPMWWSGQAWGYGRSQNGGLITTGHTHLNPDNLTWI